MLFESSIYCFSSKSNIAFYRGAVLSIIRCATLSEVNILLELFFWCFPPWVLALIMKFSTQQKAAMPRTKQRLYVYEDICLFSSTCPLALYILGIIVTSVFPRNAPAGKPIAQVNHLLCWSIFLLLK